MLNFLQRHFLTGLLAMTPLVITTWILWRFYNIINNNMRPLLAKLPALNSAYPEFVLTIMGVFVFVILIMIVGLFTRNVIGVAFFRVLERFFTQIPFVKSLFSLVQQISNVLLQDQRTAFKKVVLIAYPRPGIYSIGFVTRDELGDGLVTVFLPTSPNPTSGYMLLVPREEVRALNIPPEEAVKLIVSGGSVMTTSQLEMISNELVVLENIEGGES